MASQRNCDQADGAGRCSHASVGLFTVLGARMRLCGEHETKLRARHPSGVQLVSRWCDACQSDPCICELRQHHAQLRGEKSR